MIKKLFVSLFAVGMAFSATVGASNNKEAKAVVIDGEGDKFELSDTQFSANESFVYTAVANFESGQACGLVFGGSQDQVYWVFIRLSPR